MVSNWRSAGILDASWIRMVEAGFTRSKNTGNIIMKNLMDFCIGTCTFILIGFSLLLGEDLLGFIGKPGFDIFTSYANFDFSNFVFNLVFCATTATIVSGAMAERTNSYLIVFIQELFQHLFIQLKLIGFGVVDGYHNLDSMILLDHVQFIWLVVSLH